VRTTYNEVADELVSEFGNVEGTGQHLLLLHNATMCIIPPPSSFCMQITKRLTDCSFCKDHGQQDVMTRAYSVLQLLIVSS